MEAQEYKKLVKALRECASDDPDCIYNCPYYNHDVCADDLKSDAAAAIEALIESVHIRDKHLDELNHYIWKLEAEVKQLEPKRGEWKPFDLTYGRSIYSCSVCEQATEVPVCMEKPMYAYCPNCGAKMREVQDGKN